MLFVFAVGEQGNNFKSYQIYAFKVISLFYFLVFMRAFTKCGCTLVIIVVLLLHTRCREDGGGRISALYRRWIINVIKKGLSNDLKMPKNSQVGFDRNIILYSYNDHTFFLQ